VNDILQAALRMIMAVLQPGLLVDCGLFRSEVRTAVSGLAERQMTVKGMEENNNWTQKEN